MTPDPEAQPQDVFLFQRDARSLRSIVLVAAWAAAVGLIWVVFDARGWVLALLALPLLPSLWELWRPHAAWLRITDTHLSWRSLRSSGDISLAEIDHIRMVTRSDFSVRATIHTHPGTHHQIPPEVTPKASVLEAALQQRQVALKIQHFTVL